MPENDFSKMKVADLKRELKLRGLSITGNKTELQDRLQIALIDGDEPLEDASLGEEELLHGDEDAVLTDEDEEKILDGVENELLISPTTETLQKADNLMSLATTQAITTASMARAPANPPAKKVVLKRQLSSNLTAFSKENTEPSSSSSESTAKIAKMHEPIQINSANTNDKQTADNESNSKIANKISQLSMQERLELRAQKFGVTVNKSAFASNAKTATADPSGDSEQLEQLKKRAERFGCVTSSKIAHVDFQERLKKRQERFGLAESSTPTATSTSAPANKSANTDWAEKARMRLQRFGSGTGSSSSSIASTKTIPTAGTTQ